jgi:putative SOS response-associated peptidase YedK
MCGRFSQFKEMSDIKIRFNLDELVAGWSDPLFLKPNYNIVPSQIVPVVCRNGSRHLRLMSWGLVPAWAKDQSIGQKMINARMETLLEKPSFKDLVAKKRCIIPATGFFEWKKEGPKTKVPMHIFLKDQELFGFAGLWDCWKSPDGKGRDHHSYTIITTTPNELVSGIHDRMPVILKKEDEEQWLDSNPKDVGEVLSLL